MTDFKCIPLLGYMYSTVGIHVFHLLIGSGFSDKNLGFLAKYSNDTLNVDLSIRNLSHRDWTDDHTHFYLWLDFSCLYDMYTYLYKCYLSMYVFLTNYLSSHSIIVIGPQLIQIQSLILRKKQTGHTDSATTCIYNHEHIQVLSQCTICCISCWVSERWD